MREHMYTQIYVHQICAHIDTVCIIIYIGTNMCIKIMHILILYVLLFTLGPVHQNCAHNNTVRIIIYIGTSASKLCAY